MRTSLASTPRESNTSKLLVALSRKPQLMTFCGWCGKFEKGGVLPASHSLCSVCKDLHFPEEVV